MIEIYNVLNPKKIGDILHLNMHPNALEVIREGNRHACTVKPIPRNEIREISVSNEKLRELLDKELIERKS